jgi:hypothetical protein
MKPPPEWTRPNALQKMRHAAIAGAFPTAAGHHCGASQRAVILAATGEIAANGS